ncbi:hypothetical protein ACTMTF_15310 [Nonomuraea sp. ZG12]|uniref:hypothetical protein n=1 Tax=Nonomuraea sp. ZG12 TaxID=3452207 RepID=UPI003F8928DA
MTELAQATLESRLAVRRVGRSTLVQMCDLADSVELVMMSARFWVDFLTKVRVDHLKPKRNGDYVILEVEDDALSKRLQSLIVSAQAYVEFQRAAAGGRFDGLKPAPLGMAHGPWVWAGGTVETAESRELDGVV